MIYFFRKTGVLNLEFNNSTEYAYSIAKYLAVKVGYYV